jgi:hypothetical protein
MVNFNIVKNYDAEIRKFCIFYYVANKVMVTFPFKAITNTIIS